VYYYPRQWQADEVLGFLDRCAEAGVTALLPYFSYFHTGEPAIIRYDDGRRPYDPSDVLAPLDFYATYGWNPLAFITAEAHARGLMVHPYTAPGYQGTRQPNWHSPIGESLPLLTITRFANDHPGMWSRTQTGEDSLAVSSYAVVSFAFAEARKYERETLCNLVTRYGLDGLELEFLRGSDQTSPYGYEVPAVRSFQERTGRQPGGDSDEQWLRHRARTVDQFVAELREVLTSDAVLSVAVTGEPSTAYRWMQDWPTWGRDGLVDAITLRHTTDNPAEIASQVRAARVAVGSEVKLVSQLICWGRGRLQTADALLAGAQAALEAGADVLGVYRADSLEALGLWPAVAKIATFQDS
jgi:uncharacterized lipoprotein YddW (UPF0748 family)